MAFLGNARCCRGALALCSLLAVWPASGADPRFDLLPRAGGGQPFPPVQRMYGAQQKAMAEITEAAREASAVATPRLLALLDSARFRAHLRDCCATSGIAEWPAERLLGTLRDNVYTAELVHNFENGHSGLTLEVLLHNTTNYLPTSWQMIELGYYGKKTAKLGHPASPADAAEEGVYRLQPFSQPHDLPGTYEEASARLQYVAFNMLRLDTGNPIFGNVTVVMSPSFWKDAIGAAPIDTGIYTFTCSETYLNTPGSMHPDFSRTWSIAGTTSRPALPARWTTRFSTTTSSSSRSTSWARCLQGGTAQTSLGRTSR